MLRNLEALAATRPQLGVDLMQIDDGYQRAVGDWLETNEKFPRGLAPLAAEIRAAGFTAGLWTAPFCVVAESRLFGEHADWLLRSGGVPLRGLLHPKWSRTPPSTCSIRAGTRCASTWRPSFARCGRWDSTT